MQERRLTIAFFVYLVLEGALRKWVFPSLGTPLYLVKNLLMAMIFMVFIGHNLFFRAAIHSLGLMRSEIVLLSGYLFFTCASLFVTGFTMTAFIGLSYYLIMLPLVIAIPRILHDIEDMERLMLNYVWLAVPVCLLGIMQFNSSPDSVINRYAWNNADFGVATFEGSKPRITGTFSYITPYNYFLQFILLPSLALMVLTKNDRLRTYLALAFFLIFINIVMTGSRGPFVVSFLCATPFILQFIKIIRRKGGALSVVFITLVIGALLYATSGVVSLLSERNKEARDSNTRIMNGFLAPITTLKAVDIVGYGIGTTFMGVREIGSSEETGFDEVLIDRMGLELGFFGYLFFLGFKVFFLIKSWQQYRHFINSHLKTWALVVFCIQVSTVVSIPVYSAVAAAYYFGSIGLYVFLRNEQARLRLSTVAEQPA